MLPQRHLLEEHQEEVEAVLGNDVRAPQGDWDRYNGGIREIIIHGRCGTLLVEVRGWIQRKFEMSRRFGKDDA